MKKCGITFLERQAIAISDTLTLAFSVAALVPSAKYAMQLVVTFKYCGVTLWQLYSLPQTFECALSHPWCLGKTVLHDVKEVSDSCAPEEPVWVNNLTACIPLCRPRPHSRRVSPPFMPLGPPVRRSAPERLVIPRASEDEGREEVNLPALSETDNVKVFVRVRPVNRRELEMGASSLLQSLHLLLEMGTILVLIMSSYHKFRACLHSQSVSGD